MLCEERKASGKEELQVNEVEISQEEVNELKTRSFSLYDERFGRFVENFVATRMGQLIFEKADYFMKVLEQTAKWSLPPRKNEIPLERPLPWIFFLALIIYLRLFRLGVTLVGRILGYEPLTAHEMVYVLQVERRNLRAIRFRGLKIIANRKAENKGKKVSLMGKLFNLLNSAICRPVQQRVINIDGGRDLDDSDVQNLTVSEMLQKYGNLNDDSKNDPDYEPSEVDVEDLDDSLNSYHSSSSSEEEEIDVVELSPEAPKKTGKSKKDLNVVIVKENGAVENKSKPESIPEIQSPKNVSIVHESDNETMHTPKEMIEENDATESQQSSEMPTATAEVAPPKSLNTPTTTTVNYLAVALSDESKEKSTPGHESAASLKPPKLSFVTDAGSLQDFHSIFHPAPLIKGSTDEDKTSTSAETVYTTGARSMSSENLASANHSKDTRSVSADDLASTSQKRNSNHSAHNKKHHRYYNAKNRNKNRH